MLTIPYWILSDFNILKKHSDVSNISSNQFSENGKVYFEIIFSLNYRNCRSRSCVPAIKNPEEILLRYQVAAVKRAPEIFAFRKDFPPNLPHLNVRASSDDRVSFCLWRNQNSSLYLQHGLANTIHVLQKWLADAYDGNLLNDGWEPYPTDGRFPVYSDIGELQRRSDIAAGKILKGKVAIVEFDDISRKLGIMNYDAINLTSLSSGKVTSRISEGLKNEKNNIYDFIIVCSNHSTCYDIPFSVMPKSIDDLFSILPQENTQTLIQWLRGRYFKKIGKALVLLDIKRPKKLISDIPGLSVGDPAHHEFISLWITNNKGNFKFEKVTLVSSVSEKFLKQISREQRNFNSLDIIGCGAIGSAVTVSLARSGLKITDLWDSDILQPHNNARHECEASEKYLYELCKPIALARKIRNINSIQPNIHGDFPLDWTIGHSFAGHAIDSTGDNSLEPVWITNTQHKVHRIYIAHGGEIAVLQSQNQVTSTSQANILDIEAILFLQALNNETIASWLAADSLLSNRLLGFGCSSATMELAWSTVQHHCSALIPSLKKGLLFSANTSQLVIHALNDEGLFQGYFEITLPTFHTKTVKDNLRESWTVRYSDSLISLLNEKKCSSGNVETGGYLFGLYNLEVRYITIVHATTSVLSSSISEIVTMPIHECSEILDARNKFNSTLEIIGTWHTHPQSSSQPSSTDKTSFSNVMTQRESPTVMLIVGTNQPYIELRVPDAWNSIFS